jgi:hypothetical protein
VGDSPYYSLFVLRAIRLLAFLSSCGGPLLLFNDLEVDRHPAFAYAAAFAPVLLALLGSLSLREGVLSGWDRFVLRAGVLGVALVSFYNLRAIAILSSGKATQDAGLIAFGILVGIFAAGGYLILAFKRMERQDTDRYVPPKAAEGVVSGSELNGEGNNGVEDGKIEELGRLG